MAQVFVAGAVRWQILALTRGRWF